MPPKKKAAKKVDGYQMAKFVNAGTVIKDVRKREFVVGVPVGQGGFGMIYLTDEKGHQNTMEKARYVIKIEPKANGPLFAEIQFYMRNCKPDDIDKFCKNHKLPFLGIPKYMSGGVTTLDGEDVRFLVMPRFGRDLQKLFLENGSRFNREFCAQIATKMLYAIEYMHSRRYTHADIKGANILLGNETTKDKEELFLIDFGLAYLVPEKAKIVHKPDPRCRHDGTIEYCSTDAHDGSKPSFRGDVQILVWCLVHWAAGALPWAKFIKENMTESDKNKVADAKAKAANNPAAFLKEVKLSDWKELDSLLKYASGLDYADEVDFAKCRAFFAKLLPKGKSLALKNVKSRKSFVKVGLVKPVLRDEEEEEEPTPTPIKPTKSKAKRQTAKKSLKRTVVESSDTVEEEEVDQVRTKPSRKQPRRGTKTPAKRKDSTSEEASEELLAGPSLPPSRAQRSARRGRIESTVVELDSEITGVGILPGHVLRHNASAISESPIPNVPKSNVPEHRWIPETVSSARETESLLFSDDESTDGSISNNHEPSVLDVGEDSNPDSEQENVDPLHKTCFIQVQDKQSGAMKTQVKRIMQPGKLQNPVDVASQTEKRDPKLKVQIPKDGRVRSWCLENPEKKAKLVKWLRGEVDQYP